MSKSTAASGNWLSSIVTSVGSAIDHGHAHRPVSDEPAEIAGVCKLSRDACALQGLFARARGESGGDCAAQCGPSGRANSHVSSLERPCQSRGEALVALEFTLRSCRDALAECSSHLPLPCRRSLEDALRTLETEYVRLRDAERFLAERTLRSKRTGEADDDPEFTIILERIVCAADQGDDVAASVAQAVQKIVVALLPYMGQPD